MSDERLAPTKQEMLAEMDEALTRFLALIDQFSEEQMLVPRDPVGWTVRDHLTHLAVWAEGIAALLRGEDRWAAMGLDISPSDATSLDYEAINELISRGHRQMAPDAARLWLAAAHERLVAAVEALPDAELAMPYEHFIPPFTGRQGYPIYGYIQGNSSQHYEEHTPWIEAIVHGDSAREAGSPD